MSINFIFKKLKKSITYLETIVYILVFILICRAIILMIYNFFNIEDISNWYKITKLNFNYTVSLSLTSVLFVEILKLFYIKSLNQILIVSGIVVLKLLINYFVELEINENLN